MTKEKKYSELPASEKAPVMQDWLNEHKARDLAVFDLPEGNPLADKVIICTASSARHARSLADGLTEMCKKEKFELLRTEGYQEGQWVLVDLNDIIVHIFQEPVREMFNLEALWTDAEPRLMEEAE
ncbi:ribosome silencing factor [Mailhella sp.]|uniref:ribosome silencing factor n=1 Tax=Mailhella sp. TaxID=1981029 RepID=UPI004062E89B